MTDILRPLAPVVFFYSLLLSCSVAHAQFSNGDGTTSPIPASERPSVLSPLSRPSRPRRTKAYVWESAITTSVPVSDGSGCTGHICYHAATRTGQIRPYLAP